MSGPRPDMCCGTCPPIEGGGYDCACAGNPRCTKWRAIVELAEALEATDDTLCAVCGHSRPCLTEQIVRATLKTKEES